jgi:hypothetical protein
MKLYSRTVALWLAIVMLTPATLHAQWLQTSGPSGGNIRSLALLGTKLFAGTISAGVYLSTDRGASWTSVNSGMGGPHTASLLIIGTTLYAETEAGNYRWVDSAGTWDPAEPTFTSQGFRCQIVMGGDLFAGTLLGVSRSTDRGITWTDADPLRLLGVTHELAVIDTLLFAAAEHGIFRSSDRGVTWSPTGLSGSASGFCAAGTELFAGSLTGEVLRSSDYGNSWTVAAAGLTGASVSLIASSGPLVFVGTSGAGSALSTDNGSTWTPTSMPQAFVRCLTADGKSLYAGEDPYWYFDAYHFGRLFRSTDNAANWDTVGVAEQVFNVRAFATVGTDLVAGGGIGVFRTSDGGAHWEHIDSGLTNTDVWALGAKGSVLFAGTYGGGVFKSTNGGTSWKPINDGLTDTNVTALAVSGDYLLAGTWGGGVFKRSLTELDGVPPASLAATTAFSLEQNYPNPFNPSTTIQYALPRRSHVTLAVFNVLGQKVLDLVNGEIGAGSHEVQFNAGQLSSGVYFYRLQAGEFVQAKSLIVLR